MVERKPWEEFSATESGNAPAEQKPWEAFGGETKPEPKGFLGHARDLGLSAVKSAIALPEAYVGLADIPAGGRIGKFLENEGGAIGFRPKQAKEFLSEFHTDAYKDQQRQFQEADGILDKTAVALENPSLILNPVVESVAPMVGGAGLARKVLTAAPKLGAAAAGAIGEGTMMAGAQAEAIRQETDDGLLTAGQSGAAVATGLAGTLFGYLGGRVAQRFGLGDVDTMLARGANPRQVASEIAALPAKSIPRQVVEGAISEGFLEELPQSISEQIIQNLALGKQWSEGVEDAAVMGTLAGVAMGGGASLYSGMTRPEPQGSGLPPPTGTEPPAAPPQGFTPTSERPVINEAALNRAGIFPPAPAPIINERALTPVTPSQRMGLDPAAGPVSAAAALAVDTGASPIVQTAPNVDPETGEIVEAGARVPEQELATGTPEQMRERLAFIEQQARVNGGWDRRTIEERDRLQAELAKVEPAAGQSGAATEMVEPAPAIDVSGRTDEQLRVLEKAGRDGWREAAVAEIQRRAAQQPAETPAPAVEPAAQAAVEQQAPAAAAPSIKDVLAKQIPDMTDAELQQAIDHYGPSNKRTTKLLKEVQKRGQGAPAAAAQPTQATTAPEQSRPAPSPRSESAQPSEAIPPATSEGWDGMTAEQRAAVLTKPGGWATAKGGLNVIGKKLAGQNWTKINPATRATIERLMQGAPDVQPAKVDAASGQGAGAVPAGSAGDAPVRPVDIGRVDRPAGAPARSGEPGVSVGTAGVQQPAGVEGAADTVAAQPAAAKFDSQSGATRTQAERELWEKGAESERAESDVGVTAGTQVRFVPLADAVATVREAEQAGVEMTPFQVHQATGIRVGDAERVIREAQAPAVAAAPTQASADVARQDEGKTGGESVIAKMRKRKAETTAPAEPAEQQKPDDAAPAWRTVKSTPFADEASAVLALMNAAQKPSQSEEVVKAVRALARSAEESGDATARGIATFVADNALEALASHKINAGRGSVVEKARHKKLKDGIERLRSLEVERVTRGDETPATAVTQATHKDPGQPAEPAQQQEKAADTQAAAERTEYPFGEVPTNQESKFFRSRVRVLPEMRGDTAWDGEVGSILNGGRLLEVTRDGRDFSVRVRGERIEVLERVENGIKESEVKFDASVNDRWSSIVAATNEESGAQRSVQALARFAGATGEPVNDVWGRWRDFIGATELAGRTGEQVVRWMESNLISEPWDDRAIPGNDVNGSMGSTPDYWRSKLADYERAMTAFNEADARMDQQTFDVERVDGSPERTKAAREILSGMRKKAAENGEYIRKKVQEAEKNEAEETARAEEDRLSRFKPFDAGLASKKPSVASITGWFAGTWSNGANTAWSDGSIADLYGEPHLKGWETRKANKRTTPDVDRVIPRNSNDPLEPVGMYDSKVGQTKGVMYYQMGDSVLPFALHYVQYFMSKYKGAKLVGNLNTPSGPAAVVHEGRTVGVIMPMRVNQVTAEELRENIAKGEKITQQREKADPTAQERTEQPAAGRAIADAEREQEFVHNGVRIYPKTINAAGEARLWWGVESAENKARREAGERHGFGDSLRPTIESAMADADRQIQRDAERAEFERRKTQAQPETAERSELPAASQPALTGSRRNPAQVSAFTPYLAGDIVTIDGQDWQVQQDMGGWYLTSTGNWRGMHPAIQKIRGMNELIAEIERAATAQPATAEQGDAPAGAEATAADLLTPEQARALMVWEDLGQRDNVKSMRLAFFESAERMAAKRGAMNYGTIESYQGGKWNIDGTTYPTLKAAKAAAEDAALVRLANDGYVAQPFAAYDAVARTYGYEVRADGAIGSEGKFPGPTIKEKGGRLRVESGKGDLLGSYPATPESLGKFLENFWGAEKQVAQPAADQPASDRDQFTVERVDEDQRQTLTFVRGETVKVSGKYPMETGEIDGISNARKEFRIGGAWLPFGYAYKAEYDEFAAPRRELEEMIANAEKRIADGNGFQRDGYPIRDAREHARRYSLKGYDDTLNDLAKRGQAVFDRSIAEERARMAAAEQTDRERREAADAADAAKYAGPVKMTMDEWKRISRDFKSFNGGKRTVMQDGRIRRVEIVKEKAEAPADAPADVVFDRAAQSATANPLRNADGTFARQDPADDAMAFSATLPRDRNAVRIGITEKGLVRAMRLQFDGLADATSKLLERGRAGKRGGVIVVGTADNAEIGRIVAERTGRKLDSTMRKFSSAGRRNGFYDPKTGLTFLVAPNLNPVTATAVMLHEMMHGQQRQKIDARALEMVRNRHGLKDEDLRAFLDRVMLRMIAAGEVGNAAEASAYIVEQAVIEGRSAGYTFADNAFMQWVDAKIGKRVGDFLRSFAGMIRTWMLRNGLGAKTMTVDDFVGYAMAGLDRAAAGAVRGRARSRASIDAWHGSPYRFDRFDLGNVGMGEGAQAYGWGLYFAGSRGVAEHYKSKLAKAELFINGERSVLDYNDPAGNMARQEVLDAANAGIKDAVGYALLQNYVYPGVLERLQYWHENGIAEVRKGALYKVSIAPDEDTFLLWDKPLSEQPKKVTQGLRSAIDAMFGNGTFDAYAAAGNDWRDMKDNLLENTSEKDVSLMMKANGIAGVKYLDGMSRDGSGGSFNYVVFDDADVEIDDIHFSRSVGDAPAQEAQRVQSAVEGKTLIEAAQFMTRSKDGAKAAVAQKVLEKLQRLERAGVALDLKIVHRGDMAPASMVNARGYTETGFDEKGRDIVVWLNGADVTGKVGTEEEVLLHELVHAATAGMVFYGTQTPNSLAGKHARDLMAVTDAIAEHIRKRFDAADAGKETLTEFEQDMRDGANNAFRSDDEVLAWALSSGEAQAYLETIPYRSGSMWSNFVQAVRNLLGLGARNDTALSEVLRVAERILTDDAPAAGRAAFWHKRNIRMAQQQVRGSIVQTAERGADDLQFSRSGLRELASRATAELNNTLTAPGKLSWWHKTVGTMYNLAERSPAFRPVFQAAQGFIDDVSHYAADAAERAPKLLPRLDTWRDIMKSPISAEDNAAVGKPIFEGTLSWVRDEDGRPVRVDALIEASQQMSVSQMADELLRRGAVDPRVLNMWRGLPGAQYESAIRTRYENAFLQAGIVWTDDELRTMFNLNDGQIGLYREFRAAVDRSLDTMARADMLRFAGDDVRELRDEVMEAGSLREAAGLIVTKLQEVARSQPDRSGTINNTTAGVTGRVEKILKLQGSGYAPLSRFGKYTVDVVVDGSREYFGLFETAREANKMAERMKAEFGEGSVTQGTLSEEAYKLFAGITPESLELFGNMLGLDSTGDEAQDRAFQEYLRLTKTNRSALRRLIHRKGIAGFSEDVGRVLASFAYSNARQTAAGLHMGDLSQAVSDIPKEQGELKDVAVKLSEYIKNPQEEAQAIRGLLFAQYLGGSVASAFVNMTQPAAVTFPWLSQHGGAKMAAAEIGKAAKHIATRGHRYESDLAEALKAAEEDGVVSPQEVHQLMAQARGSGSLTAGDGTRAGNARALASNSITRLSAAWGKLFSAAEQLNRRITFIAAYRVAKQKRMEDPAAFARRAVQETQFVYSKASKMQWGRGAVGGTLMTFKTYSVAYMELMSRLWSQGAPGSAERKAGRKAVALMLAMVLLMGGGGGLPFMEDAEDLIDGIAQIAGYNVSTKKARQQFLIDTFGADAADFIERGVSGLPGVPLDVSGRLGLGNLIPGTGIFLDRSNHTRDILELLGPVGDLGNRIVTGARKALSGDVGGAALEVSPVAVRNVAKGVDMAVMDQYRDTRGRKVLDTTDLEAALKAIGFQPASVAKVQDANYLNQRAKDFYSLSADRISATWAAGIYEKDSDKVQEARDMIAQWNADNPDQPMMIRMPNILRRVREMGKDKAQRIADTAPRAMRQQLREELLRQ